MVIGAALSVVPASTMSSVVLVVTIGSSFMAVIGEDDSLEIEEIEVPTVFLNTS